LFTSGSTGAPKGVVVPHRALAAFLRAALATFPCSACDSLLAISSVTFDIALLELLLPLCAGARVHVAPAGTARDGELLQRLLARLRPTWLQATPSTYRLLLAADWCGQDELRLLCGGEALDADLAAALLARCRELWNVYGPTETTIWSTASRCRDGEEAVRIGRPLPGTECRVLTSTGALAPIGCSGELWLGGAGVANGYLGDPGATARSFVELPGGDGARFYRTGDVVRWTHDGELEFHGRADSQVKVRGHRIELGEVATVARAHPDIADAVATTITGADGVEIVLHLVPRSSRASEVSCAAGATTWHDVWQGIYDGSTEDPDFDCRGWLDSRTGRPIATATMRAFRDRTAARFRELTRGRVLEVGCGAGLVTAALAGDAEQWLAVDPAPAAVAAVAALAQRTGLRTVQTRQLAADALDQLPADTFDCVLLNSVVQYFPSLQYMLDVLAAARRRLRPGGLIVLGDVRLLPLHATFAVWVEMARAGDDVSADELADRCARRINDEPELLLAPALFTELVASGAFADRWLALRAGGADTEMDRFRADVVLTLDSRFAAATPLPAIVANARVVDAENAVEPDTLGPAVVPTADGRGLTAIAPPLLPRTPWPEATAPLPAATSLRGVANVPRAWTDGATLVRTLRTWLAQHLPAAVVPAHLVVLAALPRLASGKIDTKHLPPPNARGTAAMLPAAATPTERALAPLFAELLGGVAVARDDDFFALGGHSLAAARLLARVRATFHVDVPLRTVFVAPTVRALAAVIDRAPRTDAAPLVAQPRTWPVRPTGTMARLWFLQRLLPGSRAYLMIGELDARGAFVPAVLQAALADVVARHETLRLRLDDHDGIAALSRRNEPAPCHAFPDAAALVAHLHGLTGDSLVPLQVLHAAVAPGVHRVVFVLHHAFADAWSLAVLEHDLAYAYAARARGEAPAMAPLPLQFLDCAAWRQERLHGAERERLVTFWRQTLHDAPPMLTLPTECPRPAHVADTGAQLPVTLPTELMTAARQLATTHGASLFHVVLAAFQVWLARLAGQDDVVVGTTLANRDDVRLEGVVGCFVDSVPLRGRLGDAPSFVQHVARTRDAVLAATAHAQLPFQDLVDAVDPPRSLARTPLFQATLDWLNVPAHPLPAGPVTWTRVAHDPGTAKFELGLLVHHDAPFAGVLEYRRDLFAPETIAAWWRAFTTLFADAIARPTVPVAALVMLDEPERAERLAAGRGELRTWPDGDVFATIVAAAARHPEHAALSTAQGITSYAELLGDVAAVAHDLRTAGLRPGDRVGLHLARGREQVVALLAVLAAGGVYVPLDVDLPPARLAAMLATAPVRFGLCADPAAMARTFPEVAWRTVALAGSKRVLPSHPIDLTSTAYVLFTSGSTGTPKGVAVSHRALRNYVLWARDTYGSERGAPLHTPLGFDLSVTSLLVVLASGGTVHLPASDDGIAPLVASLAHAPFGLIKLTPSHLRALLAVRSAADVVAAARGLVLGGEALDHELLAPLRAAGPQRHWNEYGPTEATVGCAVHEVAANAPAHGPVPIGRAIANVRLYVLDAARAPVPVGVVGELWLAGASLADGYVGRADLTAAMFVADPFVTGERMYRSGDRAAWRSDGELVYHGRGDDQVKVRGHRLELGEVRTLLQQQPGVRDAAVAVRTAPGGAVHVVGWLTGTVDEATLRHALGAHLPPAAVPARLLVVPALPHDRHGKIDHAALPDPWAHAAAARAASGAADDASDAAAGWQPFLLLARELLRSPQLTGDDGFFRAGGDSILALQLVARSERLGVHLAVADVFRQPRLRGLFAAARSTADAPTASCAADANATTGPLLPMQLWFVARQFAAPAHYDQALWLTLRRGVTFAAVQAALHTLHTRHPALRTGCERIDGHWRQQVFPTAVSNVVRRDLGELANEARAHELQAIAAAAGAFDPATGQVSAATFVALGNDAPRLHWRVHHLAIDAVSWRVLAEELDALLAGHELPVTMATPIGFATWWHAAVTTGSLADDAAAFRELPVPAFPAWAAGSEGDAARAAATLDAATTRALVASGGTPHHVRSDEVVVAAVAAACRQLLGIPSLRLDVEGHGRALPGAPRLHRGVGWFTTQYPVVLDDLDAPAAERIATVKERLRGVPHGGAGALALDLPSSPVLCNYLGVLTAAAGELVLGASDDAGPTRDPRNERSHRVEVQAAVRGDALRIDVAVPAAAPRSLAAELAAAIAAEIHRLVAACASTPPAPCVADWPLAELDRSQLAELLEGLPADDAVADLYPLTPTQQGMFFHAQKDPDGLAYREQLTAVLAGGLDAKALLAAFGDVAARHELLRGEVHWRGLRVPHWRIRRGQRVDLRHVDLQTAADEARALRDLANGDRQRPFAFGTTPLLRVTLAVLAGDRHALVVTWHHVVLDGWSMPLLLGELSHHYRARCGETLPPLPPAPPWRDHVALLQAQDTAAQRAFWRTQLAGFTTPTLVPGDRTPLPATASGPWAECELRLDRDTTARVFAAARVHGVTPSTLVTAAWAAALWRCTGARDVLFGLTVAGRDLALAAAERRIGLFINTLPLRLGLEPHGDVGTFLRRVQETVAAGLVHQHTPLPLSQAQSDVVAGREPLGSLLVFENYPLAGAWRDLPAGLALESATAFERTSYPLTLVALPDDEFCLRLLHDTQRYSGRLTQSLLHGVANLLRGLVSSAPHAAVAALPWLEPEVRRGPAPQPASSLVERVRSVAARTPAAIAVDDPVAPLRYDELVARAAQLAAELAPFLESVRDGEAPLVAVCVQPGGAGVVAMLGVWWSGAAFVPLDPAWPAARLAACIAATRAVAVVTDSGSADRLPAHPATLRLDAARRPANVATAAAPSPRPANDLAYAICTSGTTGEPKVVLVTHDGLATYIAAAQERFALTGNDRVLQFASLAFDTAQEEIWPALGVGATLVPCPAEARASSARFVAHSREQRVSVWDLPTAFFHVFADALPDLGELPPQLRLCVLGGQACRLAAARTFLAHAGDGVRLVNTYGPSEATIVATWCELTAASLAEGSVPIGHPVPGTSAFVLGADLGALPAGLPGELWLAGRGLARGYLGDAEQTAARFVVHPTSGERLYRTGDRGRVRSDGQLEYLGRLDRQTKVAGVRVELDEIARVLQQHPGVTDAVVVATGGDAVRDDAIRGEQAEPVLVAHVQAGGTGIDAAMLRAFVARVLPAAFVPARCVVHERLPRNTAGKVDLRALPAAANGASSAAPSSVTTATTTEAAVVAIFRELFTERPVDADDDFFALGGSSLLAVRLLDLLQRRCGRDVPLRVVFANPTPGAIARVLDGAATGAAGDADVVPPELQVDAVLPMDFPPPHQPTTRAPEHVLLTGASGFFGSHVLAALLAQPHVRAVSCLLRATDERAGRHRLRARLVHTAAGGAAADDERVHVVLGDVAATNLGLAPAAWQRLGGEVTAVIHAAAAVDFLRPYSRLRATNVGGTLHVLRFCAAFGATLHQVSSIGIFSDPRVSPTAVIDEHDDASAHDRPVGGYAQSKWVAEQLVRAAQARGVGVVVHRPGRLVGDLAGEPGNDSDFVTAIWRLCRELGMAPQLTGTFDLTPVAAAAARLVASLRTARSGDTFHLVADEPLNGEQLLARARAAGWSGQVVPWGRFRAAALRWLAAAQQPSPVTSLLLAVLGATTAVAGEPRFLTMARSG
jgi:amino acid adenylation domain-containing protein/thioester reductase-like protein